MIKPPELNGDSSSPRSPPSLFQPLCHPRVEEVTREVNGYYLEHWDFPSEKARKKFVAADFPGVTCLYFPKALDDRIAFACSLLTVLFLIDDFLEFMSFEDGSAYNEKLIPISRGDVLPDRSVPVEYITYDLWESMRAHDRAMADEILEPVFLFMRAQTDRTRTRPMGLGGYLEYRERDVGKALLSALMRFSMGLQVSPAELQIVEGIDGNCSKHLSVINDIYSYEKELRASKTAHAEGGALCTSVQIMADEACVAIDAAKRVLFFMCREWELCHEALVDRLRASGLQTPTLEAYIKGLEYQMSGNEQWSKTTLRYNAGVR
ncbi:carbonyl reductase (NADPH-dependent) ari1 [Arachnomyces sp. PD_36]|nr:carbonyl reductase (NADPH-dependent) ari1 [Arachnomyces sp. PD_36]